MPLTHHITRNGPSVTVALSGDFTFGENASFRGVVETVAADRPQQVQVDLSGLNTVDSAALSMLMVLRDRVAKGGGSVSLVRPPELVARILEVVDFGKIFTIVR